MSTLFQDAPPSEVVGRKLVGRVLLGLLVLAAALIGATAGLLLVYSNDLPQVDELEHYRPGSITELYDDQKRIIGTFALQRRVVATYDDYPQVLRDALISIEDKDFYRSLGHQRLAHCWRGLPRHRVGRQSAGRIHANHAAGAESFSLAGSIISSQDSGVIARDPD